MGLVTSISNSRLWTRHGLKILWAIACLLLVLSIAWLVFSEYHDRKQKRLEYAPQTLQPITRSNAPQYNANDIVSANLFGDPKPKKEVVKNIPKTNLNLKLIGVLWASDENFARVIIQSGSKKANLYGIGEKIQGANASVKEIHSNEILISRNGATEKLSLVKKKGGKDIFTYEQSTPVSYADTSPTNYGSSNNATVRSSPKPRSANGANRKIRKPNFSGLDRALKKRGEI